MNGYPLCVSISNPRLTFSRRLGLRLKLQNDILKTKLHLQIQQQDSTTNTEHIV